LQCSAIPAASQQDFPSLVLQAIASLPQQVVPSLASAASQQAFSPFAEHISEPAIHGGLGVFVFVVFIAACHSGFCVFALAAGHRFGIFSSAAIGVMVLGAGGIFTRLGHIAGTAATGFRCILRSSDWSLGRGLRRSGLRWCGWLLGECREPGGTGGSQEYSYDSDFHFLSPQIF
jgi:hypothetical protein